MREGLMVLDLFLAFTSLFNSIIRKQNIEMIHWHNS